MDIGEFRRRIVEYRKEVVPRSATDGFLGELLEALDDDGPPVDVDDGFVILPVRRYEALRKAEETLQETRFEPADAPPLGKIEGLESLYNRVGEIMERLDEALDRGKSRTAGADCYQSLAALRADIRDGLKGSEYAVYRDAVATADGEETSRRVMVDHLTRKTDEISNTIGILPRHLQGLQAEIEGIKGRLDEQSDRLHGFIARMNKIEARQLPPDARQAQLGPVPSAVRDAGKFRTWDTVPDEEGTPTP
jgi:hypothetical protein